jgi:hypothetical protein
MRKARVYLVFISLILSIDAFAQKQLTDPLSNRYSFGTVGDGSLFKSLALLDNDSISRTIATTCILGTSLEELKENNFPHLEAKIGKLVSSGVLKISDGKYYLSFPVILGKKRELMYDLVWKKAMTLLPEADPVLGKLRKELGNRQDMAFHIFWTRIIHNIIIELWHRNFPYEKSDPAEIWLVYPRHPYMVGSEFIEVTGKAQLAINFNNHCLQNLQTVTSMQNILYSVSLNNAISNEDQLLLKKYGFLNSSGMSHIFSYTEGDKMDHLCADLSSELLPSFASLYDYKNLGLTFDLSEKEIFLIVLHETAYSLFENMEQLNKLELPISLKNDSSFASMIQLVSLKLRRNK